MTIARPVLALCALASAVTTQSKVWVVDENLGPGADSANLQATMNIAAPGDTLLVRSGTYAPTGVSFLLSKDLHIVADAGATVNVAGIFNVQKADATVLLRGLNFFNPGPFGLVGSLEVFCGDITAWIEDCSSDSARLHFGGSSVALIRCDFQSTLQREAIWAQDAEIWMYETVATAGTSFPGMLDPKTLILHPGVEGHAGFRASWLTESFVAGSTLTGGPGGDGFTGAGCSDAGRGGAGLKVENGALSHVRDSSFTGGPGGIATAPCLPGPPGLGIDSSSGTLDSIPGTLRTLRANAPVREGQNLQLDVAAQPGDTALVFFSLAQGHQYVDALDGAWLLTAPFQLLVSGAVPPTGTLSWSLPIPDLGAGTEAVPVYLGLAIVESTAALTLGSASATVLLDAAF